ncbi:lymphocyte-specific helicase isoform X3 [Ptiloglossa arizonensis]|uniref:lymphocyte-specific helicase isoform X3 n=1 Tax=Ptiloglossa arizonensis TaxID=3350558 RepID=UPI003FA097B8
MLFEFRKGSNATVATKNICDVYPNALDVRKCQRWFSKFKSGNFDLSDPYRSGRPTTLDNDVLSAEVEANPCQTIEELSNSLNQPWSTIQEHLQQIGKVSRAGVWVPHNLSEENKANRSTTCNLLLQRHNTEAFFDCLITGDEKWVLYDNPKRKRQWLSPNESPQSTAKPGLHPKKALLCVWWSIRGVVHFEVLKPGQTVNADLYCEQLDRVNKSLIEKWPAIVNRKGVILQHDNARLHCARRTLAKINELGWEVLPHPPYSPDVAPSDFHLFRLLQHFLSGKRFANLDDIQNAISVYFAQKPIDFYRSGIENLHTRWQKVVDNEGDTKLNNEPLRENVIQDNKRKRKNNSEAESKRLAEEEYNRELHEQQYKQLMHLLNRSKFYASYILDKINSNSENNINEVNKKRVKKIDSTNENTPPQEKEKKKNHDIRNEDVQKKINSRNSNFNFNTEEIKHELDKNFGNKREEAVDNVIETPKYFNGDLRDYQKEGFQWLKVLYENGINGILADEMGLGKTIQLIALLCYLIEKRQNGPYLIVAPLSTIPNWMIEFEKFAPNLPVILLHGSKMPLLETKFIKSLHWRYIIVDEGQRIKNHKCLLFSVLKACKSMNRLILTGTPLQNNLAELWSLLNFLLPDIFDDLAVFKSWFNAKELEYDEGTKKFFKREEEKHVLSSLREILQPFMLRREKSDVCLDIPPKKEIIVYAPLTELQLDLYKAVLNRDLQKLSKIEEAPLILYTEDGKRPKRKCTLKIALNSDYTGEDLTSDLFRDSDENTDSEIWKKTESMEYGNLSMWKQYTNVTDRNLDFLINIKPHSRSMLLSYEKYYPLLYFTVKLIILVTVTMYKKIVNHPYLVHCPLNESGLPKVDEDLIRASGKLLVLDVMLAKLKDQGHKVLLFSTMTILLDVIEDYLSLRDYKYVRLDGLTPLNIRKKNIELFNTDTDLFLFLISTRAGGVGLNLASADTVIIYDCDWNPQVDIQAMARCHRIGQTRPVVIYKFCTKGTIDESIINRGEKKRFLERAVISKRSEILNLYSKETLIQLKRLLDSKECQVVTAENEVFTEEELNKLLDRSDL